MIRRRAVPLLKAFLIIGAAAVLFVAIGRPGCDRRIAEPGVRQLVAGATAGWIDQTGLQVRRAEGFRLSGTTTDILYVLLEHPSGTNAGVTEAIEQWVKEFNQRALNPRQIKTTSHADLSKMARGYFWPRREPPSWWLSGRVAGTVVAQSPGPQVYVPDAGPNVYLVYAVH